MSDGDRHSVPCAETAGYRACRALVLDQGPLPVLDSVHTLSFSRDRIFCIRVYTGFAQISVKNSIYRKPHGEIHAV